MWLLLWLLFVLVLLALPLGYGWGYRGWGPPYPRYYRGRGGVRRPVEPVEPVEPVDAEAAYEDGWGVLADVVWVVAFVAFVWLVLALLL